MTTTLDVKELKSALKSKLDFIEEGINKGVKIDGANVEIKSEDYSAIQAAQAEANQIKSLIQMVNGGAETKAWMDAPATDSVSIANQVLDGMSKSERKSLGQMFIESPEFKDQMRANGDSGVFELKGVDLTAGMETKDVFSGMTGPTTGAARGFGTIQFDPMVPRAYRTFRVRDLFPAAQPNASLIDYFRVLGYAGGASAAASVKDRTGTEGTDAVFGLKPKSNLTFESKQAPVRTIAHWEAAHRNVLDDAPQLRSTIDNELLYGLRLEEDRQILSGSGSNDQLLGILNTSGIQTYAQSHGDNADSLDVASEPKSDALRRAATKVLIANYQATGYVLNPNDWEDVELQKGSGDGQYMLVTNIAIGAQSQVWRQPVVETVAIAEGTFLTGAFGLGAQLYDRQIANVRTSESHADFFVRNAIVILVEERLALAVKRPEAFVKGTFWVDETA